MYEFSSDYAYNAFQMDTLKTWDLKKVDHLPPHLFTMANFCARWALRYPQQHCGHTSKMKTGSLQAFCQHRWPCGLTVNRMNALVLRAMRPGRVILMRCNRRPRCLCVQALVSLFSANFMQGRRTNILLPACPPQNLPTSSLFTFLVETKYLRPCAPFSGLCDRFSRSEPRALPYETMNITQNAPFRFGNLPKEIRVQIYKELFCNFKPRDGKVGSSAGYFSFGSFSEYKSVPNGQGTMPMYEVYM
jgi:hypothetical protein